MYISRSPKREQLYYIYKIVVNRRNLNYTMLDVIRFYYGGYFKWASFCCRKRSTIKHDDNEQDRLMNKAIRKLHRDMDIVKLLHL